MSTSYLFLFLSFVFDGVLARASFYYCIIPYVFGMGFYYSCSNLLASFEGERRGEREMMGIISLLYFYNLLGERGFQGRIYGRMAIGISVSFCLQEIDCLVIDWNWTESWMNGWMVKRRREDN